MNASTLAWHTCIIALIMVGCNSRNNSEAIEAGIHTFISESPYTISEEANLLKDDGDLQLFASEMTVIEWNANRGVLTLKNSQVVLEIEMDLWSDGRITPSDWRLADRPYGIYSKEGDRVLWGGMWFNRTRNEK